MPIFDKEKREQRKDNRLQKKEERGERRDAKLTGMIGEEASKAGIDLANLPAGPMTDQKKQSITQSVKELATDDVKKDIESFAKAYEMPKYMDRPGMDQEALKENLKKQRKARWFDALYALGEGFQGRTADPRVMKSKQLEADRKKQYDQYRGVVESNKARAEQWESRYRDDLMNFLKEKSQDKSLSPLEQAKIKEILARAGKADTEAKWIKNKPYYKPTPKGDSDKFELVRKTDDGRQLKITLGKDKAMQMTALIDEEEALKRDIDDLRIKMQKEKDELSWYKSEADTKKKYNDLISAKQLSLEEKGKQINQLIRGEGAPTPQQGDQDDIDDTDINDQVSTSTTIGDIAKNL